LRIGKTLLRYAKVVQVLPIMLHNEVPHVIGQGHTSRPRRSGELRLYLFRNVERYPHTLRLWENRRACNMVKRGRGRACCTLTLSETVKKLGSGLMLGVTPQDTACSVPREFNVIGVLHAHERLHIDPEGLFKA